MLFILLICTIYLLQLDDKPVQHREVMDNESERFRSYFSALSKMKGG